MSGQALAVRDLVVAPRRGAPVVLHGITFDHAAESTLALLGTSGAGKTTLLRALAGLVRPQSGSVHLGDRLLDGDGVHVAPEARRVGVVFQGLELWPHLTAGDHVAFALRASGVGRGRRADVEAWFERVGLAPALTRRRPGALSGGERQRVAIARTLAAEPSLVLYDEPLAHVDPTRRQALRALLRELARERRHTAVLVTHDPDDALEIADHVAILEKGRVAESGVPRDVLRTPRTEAAARAFGAVTLLPATWRGTALDTVLGPLEPAGGPGATDGRTVRLALRPDDVRARAPHEGVAATVVDRFETATGTHVIADVAGTRIEARADVDVPPGAAVGLVVVSRVTPLEAA
ncbi:MAG: ABC transporter ATP-binding protein [Planctomycetes bacterium]|nr:ABC transporter ATP-binding protein [Planctomycetota bacterium]